MARTVVAAVDAANAPSPGASVAAAQPKPAPPQPVTAKPQQLVNAARATSGSARTAAASARQTSKGVREGARRFGLEVWRPLRRASGVLWLEFTGVFFGIFALFAFGAAWKLRGAWHVTGTNTTDHQRLMGAIAMLAVFGYFAVSSFVRASRRGRVR